MEGLQANTGFPQNPPKQYFKDVKKFMVGQGGREHQQSGDNWAVPRHTCGFRFLDDTRAAR